jgi:hypothetical protein
MTQALIEAMKRIVHQVLNTVARPRWAIVTSVDTSGSQLRARVTLQPEGITTGWLPVLQPSSGPGATGGFIPSPGWMAFVHPDFGEAEHGVVAGFAHSDLAPMPQTPNAPGTGGTPSTTKAQGVPGEFIVNAFGSTIRVCAGGSIFLQPGGGTVFVDGSIACNGDVSDRHGSLDRLRQNYDAHQHPGVQSGGGSTGTTDHNDPE